MLHSDKRWLPVRERAWASWNYRLNDREQNSACVTYNMNILQGLPVPLFCVTLNPDAPIDERYVWQRFVYEHPQFNPKKLACPDAPRRDQRPAAKLVLRCLLVQRISRGWRAQRARRGNGDRKSGRGMNMNSCLYQGVLRHRRLLPRAHRRYSIFGVARSRRAGAPAVAGHSP